MQQTIVIPQLGLGEALDLATSRIFQITGRSRRSEYWWTMLIVYIASIVLPVIGWIVGLFTIPLTIRRLHDTGRSGWWYGAEFIMVFFFLAFIIFDIVSMAMHPGMYSGHEEEMVIAFLMKYGLFFLIISVYKVVVLVFLCMDSEKEDNEYGESPKYKVTEDYE